VFEHTNAKGTTYGESVAETLPKKKNCPFCEFLIFGVFVCASVLIFIFFFLILYYLFLVILTCKKKKFASVSLRQYPRMQCLGKF
jgi:hypothetical protein